MKDGHNCTAAQSYTINSTSSPAATPTISGMPSSVTCGTNASFTISNPCSNCTYSWTTSTNLTGTGTTFSITNVHGANPYAIVLLTSDNNGCQNLATFTLTVNPPFQMSVSPPVASGCSPVCIAFNNNSTASGICQWNFDDGTTATNSAPVHCYMQAGTFHPVLQLTDANGCVGRDTVTINVDPIPTASFSASPQPTTLNNPTVNFTDLSNGALVASWQWDFGVTPAAASSLQNPFYTYPDTGTYFITLKVTSNYGCYDSIVQTVRIDPAVGVQELHSVSELFMHPNPVTNTFILRVRNSIGEIEILNALGEQVWTAMSSQSEAEFNIANLPSGIYILRRGYATIKFFKQ